MLIVEISHVFFIGIEISELGDIEDINFFYQIHYLMFSNELILNNSDHISLGKIL